MTPLDPPLGVVLAGGQGRRMGGGKPFKKLAGHSLVNLAVQRLRPFCSRLMVVAGELEPLAYLDCELVADRWPGQGPLAAILTAMLACEEETLLVLAVDLPLVRPGVLEILIREAQSENAVALAGPTGIEPLLAVYKRSAIPAAQRLVDAGERRIRMLLQAVGAKLLGPEYWSIADPEALSLVNVNHPEDLDRAARLAQSCGLFDTQ